jgi:hypothetical protein
MINELELKRERILISLAEIISEELTNDICDFGLVVLMKQGSEEHNRLLYVGTTEADELSHKLAITVAFGERKDFKEL